MQVCPRGTWNTRMLVETVLSMLTTVCHSKQVGHRVWAYCRARIAWMMAAFNLLARWSLAIDDENMVRLSIAEFGPNKLTPLVTMICMANNGAKNTAITNSTNFWRNRCPNCQIS
jgi:hypothetical protein